MRRRSHFGLRRQSEATTALWDLIARPADIDRQIMGRKVVVAITNDKLDSGPWEQIFYGEFAGNRRKRLLVKIIGE